MATTTVEELVRSVLADLQPNFSEKLLAPVLNACQAYLNAQLHRQGQTPGELRKKVLSLDQACQRYIEVLEGAEGDEGMLAVIGMDRAAVSQALERAGSILLRCRRARGLVGTPQRGPVRDRSLRAFLERLARAFRKEGKRGPSCPSVRKLALRLLEDLRPHLADMGISFSRDEARQVDRVLKELRKKPVRGGLEQDEDMVAGEPEESLVPVRGDWFEKAEANVRYQGCLRELIRGRRSVSAQVREAAARCDCPRCKGKKPRL